MDRTTLYSIIYALAACDGREDALFGGCAKLASDAFERSLAGPSFPELWFELPLLGDPWFDLHVLTSRDDLTPDMEFPPERTGGCPEAFRWFACEQRNVRQLALSYDVSSGDISRPAVQILVGKREPEVICSMLEAVGRADAEESYRTFASNIPKGWFACYTGVFPSRKGHNLRVECIPARALQDEYAHDPALLEHDLRSVGFEGFGETLLDRCTLLAGTPMQYEMQFDVMPDGSAGSTLGASVRFYPPPSAAGRCAFENDGPARTLMGHVEEWGLADERWRLLPQTAFAKRVRRGGKLLTIYCYPAFIKLRWRNGEPLDAKAYLIAGTQ